MAMTTEQFAALCADLAEESAELLAVLTELPGADWHRATPAAGWDIHDQIVHLAFFDDLATTGFTDAEEFERTKAALLAKGADWVDQISHELNTLPADETLRWFIRSRATVLAAFAAAGPNARTPWMGPGMSAASAVTARLMETWAHAQDVYDALELTHSETGRIRHVAHLGILTRAFTYQLRGLHAPESEIRVELRAPDDEQWAWGNELSPDRVTGSARDFALVVTQRRNLADTDLICTAGAAAEWMSIAQAYAGVPGLGRPAGASHGDTH